MSPTIIPPEAGKALLTIQRHMKESLSAVYIHGSTVSGGLRPGSDVDLLAVTDRPLTSEVRSLLAAELMLISGTHPYDIQGRRPLEVIVFLQADLTTLRYPARCEFIYGEWLRQAYTNGLVPEPFCDAELTLILAQSRREAIALTGPGITKLLPPVPGRQIRQAIQDALPVLIKTWEGDETNVLLTLARMWHTLITGQFVPKDIAAQWAEARLPVGTARILAAARESYLSIEKVDWRNRGEELGNTINTLRNLIMVHL